MEKLGDTYKTIASASQEILLKERKSKFFGQAFPVSSEAQIKSILEKIKAKHPQSGHICYAWRLGIETSRYRANDDGEPTNSAGMPIYGQIQSFGVTHVLVTVTRYFGGTKLGVGGLISAYRDTAKLALEESIIVQKRIVVHFELHFPYAEMNNVMRIIKQKSIGIANQEMGLDCKIKINVPKNESPQLMKYFESFSNVRILKNPDQDNFSRI